mgnify:CR=1 FL=1
MADIYEALTSDRPYRRAMAVGEVVDILRSDAGTTRGRLHTGESGLLVLRDATFRRTRRSAEWSRVPSPLLECASPLRVSSPFSS